MTGQLVVMGEKGEATGETNLLLIRRTSTSSRLFTVKFQLVPNWELLGTTRTQIFTNALFRESKSSHKCITMKICLFIQTKIDTREKMLD